MGSLNGCQIISLVGYQGSGKSTIGDRLSSILECGRVEVSSVVKLLTKITERKDLPATKALTKQNKNWLGVALAAKCYGEMQTKNTAVVVLTGNREQVVLDYLREEDAEIWVFEISAEPADRLQRLLSIGKISSTAEFLEHELKEREMGLPEVINKAGFIVHTAETTNPERIAERIISVARRRGVLV